MSRAFKMCRDADLAWRCSREGRLELKRRAQERKHNAQIAEDIWQGWRQRQMEAIPQEFSAPPPQSAVYEIFQRAFNRENLTGKKEEE